ncbi:PAS domain-containing hybrid sensor histidine kinase/response regulator [Roseomonas nepalensis]|uniref:histidine kinase n=1 Tax=Muricoccus nepalensis TaxID=1854500 RepID=A0A502GFS6_9PROT|nr:PAS domain-containing protein [Roseomonas nepalensis]TPG60398.1 PAS domain-containing hybrid sensor histidine kinase/response regulator [Roseomonas nepalensis]
MPEARHRTAEASGPVERIAVTGAARRGPALGLRARLLLLVLAAVLPVLLFAGLVLWRFAGAQRDGVERSVLARAEALARVVDAEFEALSLTLRAVSGTPAFAAGDREAVRQHMVSVGRDIGSNLVLRAADGRLLLHTAVPRAEEAGAPLARPPWLGGAEAPDGRFTVSDLFTSPMTGAPTYAVVLPVSDAQGHRLLLGAAFRAARLAERLRLALPEEGWGFVVADRAHRVVAQSRAPEAALPESALGADAGPGFHGALNGVQRGRGADGVPIVFAHARTEAGWDVGASLVAERVNAPVRGAVQALAGLGAVLLSCALLLALAVASRIAGAAEALAGAATVLGQGRPVPPVRTPVPEMNTVGAALSRAGETIAARDRALREREAQLARTQRLARVGGFELLVEHDVEGGPRFRNLRSPEYLALHGLPPDAEEEPHADWVSRLHPGDRERVSAAFLAAVAAGGPDYVAEYRVLTPEGETRWISALAEVERDGQGRAIRFRGVHVDLSSLRRTEARLAENRAALAAAEERLRLAMDASGLVAFDVDLGTRRGVFSPGHFALIGRPAPPDGVGDLAAWEALIHPEDRAGVRAAWRRMLVGGAAVTVEHRVLAPAGERWIAATGRLLPGPPAPGGGRGERCVGVYADVTGRRAAQAVLEARVGEAVAAAEAAQAQLAQAQKMEALGQLTGGVAHDFNNLLQVVASGAALLGKRPSLLADPAALRLLEGMAGAAERGGALTRRMLAFARRQELRMGAVDTAALILALRDILARSLGPATPLEIEVPDGLWWVHADPNQLELALLNLCVNARDAMPPERFPGGRVRLAARNAPAAPRRGLPGAGDPPPSGDCLVILVSDEGAGMDAETLARATEPFFTTKGVGRGTGLGLSMVHGLCAQSGGALRLSSVPGRGTTAEIWLPRAEPGSEAAPPPLAVPTAPPAARRLSVLLVDDDPLVLSSSAALLADLGHAVCEAGSAAAALEALRAGPVPDAVVTDHAMPGMTGAELAGRIAARHPGLPVILATGYADLPAGEAPEVPRLDKPFGRDALAAALAAATGGAPPA